MKGATPAGAHTEQEAAGWVRGMFGRIAYRYDLANHLLSFNIDRHWRAVTARRVGHILSRPEARVLDICCGTGDLLLALANFPGCRATVFGSDFCHPMLAAARGKIVPGCLFESDVLSMPLHDASFDLVTVAFGFRNLANYAVGLAEMRRVLRPGGTAAILEFSQPPNRLFAAINRIYCRTILPVVGGLITGQPDAYQYLPDSVRKFPGAEELADEMRRSGFQRVSFEYLTGGMVALHLGQRASGA